MSTLATLHLLWAAVYGYLCAYHLVLYGRRRDEREYLAFALLTAGFSVLTVGNALHVDADTLAGGTLAVRVGNVALTVVVAFYVEFVWELTGRRGFWLRALAYVWAVVGLGAEVLGLMNEPFAAEPRWGWGGVEPVHPAITSFGVAYLAGLWTIGLVSTALFFRHATKRPSAPASMPTSTVGERSGDRVVAATSALLASGWPIRLLGVAAVLAFLAGSHDFAVRVGLVSGPTLMDHVAMLFAFAMSYALLDRFVRASNELRSKTAELARAYEELRDTQERLVRKEQLAAVGELSAVIAHEVRNPLAVIKNSVSGLRRRALSDEDRATLLSILDEETDRLNRLVHDLLAYAQPVVPQGRELALRDLVRRAVERARSSVAHAGSIETVYELEGPASVYGDPELLRHALVNVIENALQAMPGGGTLTVRSEAGDLGGRPAVSLVFSDTGEGMDTLVRAKARDPFFTTRPSGTGLGLAIVERVVRNHGGKIEIESRHGAGTTIRFLLPCERPSLIPIPPPERREGRISAIREAPPGGAE
ncbi:MAG: hypothetical protein KF901_12080 [Myxococcales bacterium]|nr:hypothetical protein [Myxococcales bacterium]